MSSAGKIPLRRLGKTDLMVTVMGFGGIPIQIVDEGVAIAAVQRCFDLGVNFYDTARGYSNSEERIGKALAGHDYHIASKSGARDADGIYSHVGVSLTNLHREQIDVYQLHGVNDDQELEKVMAPGGAMDGLRRAKAEGKIAHIGITGHRPETLMHAIEQCDEFATVQVPFNLVESEILETLIPLCQKRDVGIIAMKPVGGGNFTNAPLAIKWCINQPISVAIPGMATPEEAEEDVAVATGDIALSPVEQAACVQMKGELDQRTCRRCRYCEPCPNAVQIGMLLHGRSVVRRMGAARFKEWGAAQIIASAAHCTECGTCITKCPYQLPIPELVREVVAFYRTVPELSEPS
jgi:predicted aldo/keto reductase-like oxidoreductase